MAGGATAPAAAFSFVSPRTLAARRAQALQRALDLGDHSGRHASVAGRRLKLVVSEQCLNQTNIRTALEQMGREAVAKRMQRERLAQPRGFCGFLEQPSELARGQAVPMITATWKQPALFRRDAAVIIRGRPRPSTIAATARGPPPAASRAGPCGPSTARCG